MNKLKFDNSNTEEGGLSRRTGSFTKRFLAMTGAAALVVGGAGSVFIGAGAASATTTVSSSTYIVGSQVSGVTLGQSSTTESASAVYTLGFTATDGIAAGGSATLTLTDGAASGRWARALTKGPTSVIVTSGGNSVTLSGASVGYAPGSTKAATTVTMTLPSTFSVANGAAVTVQFTASNGAAAHTYTASVSTSSDSVPASGTSYTLVAAASAAITTSLSNAINGASATLTLGSMYLGDSTATPAAQLTFPSAAGNQGVFTLTYGGGTLPSSASNYTITATNSTGVVTTLTSADFAVAYGVGVTDTVSITLNGGTSIAAGDLVSISVAGAINPASGTTSVTPVITATETGTKAATWVVDDTSTYSGTAGTVNSLTLGSPTSVTGLSITPASTTSSASTSYSINFKATSALVKGNLVNVALASGTVLGTSAYVVDATSGTSYVATVTPGTGSAANTGTVTLTAGVSAGDSVTVTLIGVTNPTAGGSDSGTISTTSDSVAATANYAITAATTSTLAPIVTLSSGSAGGSATYTITDISASAAYATGSTTGQIGLYFPSGTGLPTAPSQYSITDLTNSSGTGAPASVSVDTTTVTGDNGVTLTVSKSISMNDQLKIVVTGAINPVGGSYSAQFTGLNGSVQTVAPSFPTTAMTYPNGAFVQSGAQIDVIAGGYGFGISTQAAFAQLQAMDPASVVTGTFPAATGPRAGTLIQVAGSAGIWVVGTDGKIYQFSSASQFMADGYSPMQVVQVPSSGGLTVGTGAAPTAAMTLADGSIQNFGGTYYVYSGGHAFGIPTQADAAAIEASTGSMVITGSGSAPTSATIADGSLIQPVGSAGIYVTSGGSAYQFNSGTQLRGNGYTVMFVVMVPSLGSVTVG
ncbi:beta strand repeat-containing protein [Acidithrix ferrooxidans]|uniref:Uncharacterized protein n=1 Tax=Acidithrix ferrooxidans TaxID=1280514 RepID=A0A0D8HFQ8_9ACTN|nr:hypothetical protein [Acidithrix ferrooxidans]KJF16719.1 hypothetical protein AXFE_23840 [Acidithrix ferrooxidans]